LDPHEVLFADLVAHSKKDAAAQEGLVGIISDVLEWYDWRGLVRAGSATLELKSRDG
jgi:hypothetical protein